MDALVGLYIILFVISFFIMDEKIKNLNKRIEKIEK